MDIQKRTQTDKASDIRKKDMVPAVIYGPKVKANMMLAIPVAQAEELYKAAKRYNTIIHFEKMELLAKDFSLCKITNKVLHIDFYKVEKNTPFITKLPVQFINVAKNTAISNGGMLQVTRFYVDVKIDNINNMPDFIVTDVSQITQPTITASALELSKGVSLITKSKDLTIAAVIAASGAKKN